jgi:hypothetical protein
MKAKILWANSEMIEKELTPIKAIRAKCMQCANYNPNEITKCPCPDCALFNFRFGKNPDRKPMSEERKQEMRERIKTLGIGFQHKTTSISG